MPHLMPVDWNIVIAGAWNVAILTPEGIKRRLFQLDQGTAIEVQVALDIGAPIKVKYENIVVQPSSRSLVISPLVQDIEHLGKSVEIAKRALSDLPETPLVAAGVNFRFLFPEIPNELIEAGESVIDGKLADMDLNIVSRVLKRKIKWKTGALNLEILEQEDSSGLAIFNYHMESDSPSILSVWLDLYKEMEVESSSVIKTVMRGD